MHYASFLPLWEHGLLLIVTEFDGAMQDYVMDFAAVLDDEFSLILSYMKGYDVRHLPVSAHLNEFWAYVDRCVGESLARHVTAVAIGALLDRCPSVRVGEVGPWAADPYFRSLTKLQLLLR